MITDDDSVELSHYCFDVCEALNDTIQEKTEDGLDGSAWPELEDLTRYSDCLRVLLQFAPSFKSQLQDHPRDRAGAQGEGKHCAVD